MRVRDGAGADCWVHRFNPRRKLDLDPDEWRRVLHHVTVEVLALAQAGRDVNALYTERAVNMEDWERTKRVQVKVKKDGEAELHFFTAEAKDLILKAMPQSLAEEIVKAAENAETSESAEATPKSGAAKPAEEESTEDASALYASLKQADMAEKLTMRAISKAVKATTVYTKPHLPPFKIDNEWMRTPLTDPTIKLAVSSLLVHNGFELNSDPLPDP
jgi:hypothetical protein